MNDSGKKVVRNAGADARDDLFSISYISRCRIPPWEITGELADIEKDSIRNNALFGITGKLICRHGHFVQRLEGPKQKVEETMDRIRDDHRHDNITMLSAHPITRRMYDDWQQLHIVTDGPELGDLDAILGPLSCRAVQSTDDHEAAALLGALQNIPASNMLLPDQGGSH